MDISISPISLQGLSFFEFDKFIGNYGEFQIHSIQIIAADTIIAMYLVIFVAGIVK